MMDLCKWKSFFGDPGKGVHSYRIFNIAIIDVIFTLIVAYYGPFSDKFTNFILLLILGIILHRVFCVNTTVNKYIFGEI
jgi:hypothetical protein